MDAQAAKFVRWVDCQLRALRQSPFIDDRNRAVVLVNGLAEVRRRLELLERVAGAVKVCEVTAGGESKLTAFMDLELYELTALEAIAAEAQENAG